MLLISGCGTNKIDNLARMEHGSLRDVAHDLMASDRTVSANAKSFILHCLQLAPKERMTSTEATCHDWFHMPTSHYKFFMTLDSRMAAQ